MTTSNRGLPIMAALGLLLIPCTAIGEGPASGGFVKVSATVRSTS